MVGFHTPALVHVEEEIIERCKQLSSFYGKTITPSQFFNYLQGDYESREWTFVRKDGSTFPVQLVVSTIKNLQGDITGYFGVATDISEIKKAEKEMKSLLQITTNQNNRLKNFAHIVSHNLGSLSGNIKMLVELYMQETPEAEDNIYLSNLKISTGNLMDTITNLNEVVKINTSSDIELVPLNLRKMIEAAKNNVGQLAREASVIIINNVDANVTIMGLPAYAESILLNFITNGIKYRSPNRDGLIVLSTFVDKEFVVLTVEDNGLGINLAKDGDKLFGMYKTFHGNADARGIGLFITKNQVEAIGGKIAVESEVDRGTTFSIWFQLYKIKEESLVEETIL